MRDLIIQTMQYKNLFTTILWSLKANVIQLEERELDLAVNVLLHLLWERGRLGVELTPAYRISTSPSTKFVKLNVSVNVLTINGRSMYYTYLSFSLSGLHKYLVKTGSTCVHAYVIYL